MTHGRSSREGWARARGARGRRRLGRDCGDVCSVRKSRTITLKVRRSASAGHSRVQRGESGLRRRSVRESGTITLKGARHPRRLCPVGPHIQQRLLIAPPFIVG